MPRTCTTLILDGSAGESEAKLSFTPIWQQSAEDSQVFGTSREELQHRIVFGDERYRRQRDRAYTSPRTI